MTGSGLLRVPVIAVMLCPILPVGGGFVAAGRLGMQFFPAADRDRFEVQVWTGQDAGIGRTAGRVQDIEQQIRAAGDVRGMFWAAGASSPPVYYNQLRDLNDTPSYARGAVLAADPAEAKRLVGRLQRKLPDAFPDTCRCCCSPAATSGRPWRWSLPAGWDSPSSSG